MTNLDALKEKMKFRTKFEACPHHDQGTHIRHKAMFDGAKLENKRLQAIVLKEMSELVEALEHWQDVAESISDVCTSNDEVDRHVIGLVEEAQDLARQALAKFGGDK